MTRATLPRRVGVPVLDLAAATVARDRGADHTEATRCMQALLGTPHRWAGQKHFTWLDTDFGLGHGFLALWQAWRDDPERPDWLYVIALATRTPTPEMLAQAHADNADADCLTQLIAAWPPATANLHLLSFEGGRVRLLLGLGDEGELLRDVDARVDAFRIEAHPNSAHHVKAFARLAAPAASLLVSMPAQRAVAPAPPSSATAAADPASPEPDAPRSADTDDSRHALSHALSHALRSVGFVVADAGPNLSATYAPAFVPRQRTPRRPAAPPAGRVLIVGGGLAGAAMADALADLCWSSTVLDQAETPASQASGNPAGLFHGALHSDDAAHARFNRAAALLAARKLAPLIASGAVAGQVAGLLRVASEDANALQALANHQQVPAAYAQALTPAEVDARSACSLGRAAWLYTQGGWVDPGALVRHWLAQERVTWQGGATVAALRRVGARWQALDGDGECLAEGDAVVVSAAQGSAALLHGHADSDWPLELVRGQVSWWPQAPAGAPRPAMPLTGAGYAIALPAGGLLFGATAQVGDTDPALRDADHQENLQRLALLSGWDGSPAAAALQGRVAWRCVARDRLPLAGAAVLRASDAGAPEPVPGLYVATALGSRGITWAPLMAACVAALIAGTPPPLERRLMAAIAPARWLRRQRER